MMMTYCVIYRTGGTANFAWQHSLAFTSREHADDACAETRRMGYPAHVERYDRSLAIGLPETFEARSAC